MEVKPAQKREGICSRSIPSDQKVSPEWILDFTFLRLLASRLGEGSFGLVVAAKDAVAGKRVAIKKIKDAVEDEQDGKRLLRELKLLRYCRGHENFIIIKDIILSPPGKDFKDIYIVTDLMDTDLHRIVRSPQPLSDDHGLARLSDGDESLMTCYVVTRSLGVQALLNELPSCRWYRAPELLLGNKQYTCGIHAAKKAIHAFYLGTQLICGLSAVSWQNCWAGSRYSRQRGSRFEDKHSKDPAGNISARKLNGFFQTKLFFRLPKESRVRWADLFPRANTQALDLLDNLIQFNPEKRLTAEQALAHPYMHELHDVEDEPSVGAGGKIQAPDIFDFSFERQKLSVAQIREIVVQESLLFSNQDNSDLAMSSDLGVPPRG
eukprot:755466-Hanusia_phi.AAC.2